MRKNCELVGQIDAVTGHEEKYESMADRSIRCAIFLQSQNVAPGDVIAICTHNQKHQIIPALAAMYIGAIFNPWLTHSFCEGWYRTEDVGYYEEDGNIFVTDHLNDMIVWRYDHMLPSDIEKVIETHPAVAEVAVIGVSDYYEGEIPMAFVVARSGVSRNEIMDLVHKKLPDYMRLRAGIKFIDEIPRDINGKVNKLKLKSMASNYHTLHKCF